MTGRIVGGEFELEMGRPVQIWSNEASGHVLHGGEESFAYQNWSLEPNCAKKHYVKSVLKESIDKRTSKALLSRNPALMRRSSVRHPLFG